MRRPLLSFTASFAFGIALGRWLSPTALLVALAAPVLAVALPGLLARRLEPGRLKPIGASWLLLLAGAALAGGGLLSRVSEPRVDVPRLPDRPIRVAGAAVSEPREGVDAYAFDATLAPTDDAGRPIPGAAVRARVTGRGSAPALEPGQPFHALVRLRPVRPDGNPGERTTSARRLAAGVPVIAHPLAGTAVTPARPFGSPPSQGALSALRRRARLVLSGLPDTQRQVLRALLLGDSETVEPGTRSLFAETGAAHLLAISGLHLGMIAGFLLILLRAALGRIHALLWRGLAHRLAAAATVALCGAYTLMTGAHVPTVRAAVMIAVHLGGRALGLRSDPPTSLAAAALVLLLGDPQSLLDPGFQLSFTAAAGLLLSAPAGRMLTDRLVDKERRGFGAGLLRGVVGLAWASVAAFLTTTPIVLAHFGSAPLGSPLVNMVVIPYLGLVLLPLSLVLTGAALAAPAWSGLLLWPVSAACELLLRILRLARPFALPIHPPTPGTVATIALVAAALCLVRLPLAPRRAALAIALALATASCAEALSPRGPPSGRLAIVFLNVGHGDATVLRLPDGTGILVDGGGRFDDDGATGRRTVLPALAALGIDRLRAMVLTHPDADHLHGLLPVAAALPIDELWWSGHVTRSPTQLALLATLAAGRTRLVTVGARDAPRRVGGVVIDVLSPDGHGRYGTYLPGQCANASSVVLRVTFGGVTALLMGDAEAAAEQQMGEDGALSPSTIVKIPHHGSTTSSTPAFVRAVRPAHAVASCDEAAHYGLPSAEILERYRAVGAQIHRTDRDGAVQFETDGERLWVRHGSQRHAPGVTRSATERAQSGSARASASHSADHSESRP